MVVLYPRRGLHPRRLDLPCNSGIQAHAGEETIIHFDRSVSSPALQHSSGTGEPVRSG